MKITFDVLKKMLAETMRDERKFPITLYIGSKRFGYVEELVLLEMPIIGHGNAFTAKVADEASFIHFNNGKHMTARSLRDMGIIPNNYNDYQVFDNREEAEIYSGLKVKLNPVKEWRPHHIYVDIHNKRFYHLLLINKSKAGTELVFRNPQGQITCLWDNEELRNNFEYYNVVRPTKKREPADKDELNHDLEQIMGPAFPEFRRTINGLVRDGQKINAIKLIRAIGQAHGMIFGLAPCKWWVESLNEA